MKDSLKMIEINKDVSNSLFLKIFDGMSGRFTYYELIIDEKEIAADYKFILVNTPYKKKSKRSIEAKPGKTIKEIFPNIKQSCIDKIGDAILDNKPSHFAQFNPDTKRYFHVNSFSKGENKFVIIIDDITTEKNSIEELIFQIDEKEKRADELAIANKELAFQNEEKDKRAEELAIANKELAFQNEEKDKRADELAIANKELAFQNEEKDKRAEELALANKELAFQDEEKAKREAELAIANKELAFQNQEKIKRADELVLANKELAFQNELTKNRIETESVAKELRQFIETANAPIFGIDSKGLVNEWNQTSEKITGFKKEDVLGENLVETYITEDYRDAVKQVLDNALRGKETANYEFPLFTKDGKRVMVLLNSSSRRNAGGEIIGVLGVGQDISEIDKLRTESESVAKELRQFIETANAPIFGIDSKGLVNEWNQTSEKITGFKKEEVLGKDLVETYITEDYRDAVKKVLDNAIRGKETTNYEFPLFTKDGKRVMVLLNSSSRRNAGGEIVGVLGVGQDISEIDKLRTESESVAKELRQFIETANAPIFGIDSKGLVNEWNQTSEKITGFKKEEVLGKDLVETYITEDYRDAVKQVLDDALRGKETTNYEFPLFTKDGKRVMVLLNSSSRRNAGGEIVGVLGVGQDISEIDKLRTESESVAKELRQFIETANAPIFGIDSKGLVNEWNQTSEKITGFKKVDVLGENLVETYITEDYRVAVKQVLDNALKGQETANYEFPLFTKDGKRVMVLLNSSTRRDVDGKIVGVLGVGQDISEMDKLRTTSEAIAKELRQFIETANAPIFGIDSEGLVNEWNQTSEKITGFKKEDVLGENLVETYITEDYRVAVKQVLDNALKGQETANYEFPLFTKDGKRVMVLLNSSTRRDVDGKIVGVLGVGQDISEMDKLRTTSEAIAKELRQFIETANAPIFGIDSKGLVNEWNQTSEKITGFKKEDVLGENLVETYITEDYRVAVKQVLDNALKGQETANYEFPLFTKDGKRVMVLLNSSTRRDVDGKIVGVLGVGQDITILNEYKENLEYKVKNRTQELAFQNDEKDKRAAELVIANKELAFQNDEKEKRAVELVIAKEKAEESDYLKTAFLANMSHEIRTPMNGILGFSELLKTPNLSGEKQQDYIRIIEKSGHRMLNTINDIISISKIESGLMEVDISESNVNEQIEYIHTFFKPEVEGKGLKFFTHNDLPFDLAVIKTDREKIFAILTNLVKNAIKFTEIGSIEIGYIQKDEYLEFYVKDSGVGIDNDRKVAIFERFIQADISDSRAYEGAGLGLSISKAFVEMLGGELRVESEKGKGSVFYFTTPYIAKKQKKIEAELDTLIDTQGENLKILIVEDDEISDLLLSIRLNKISREILHASNGLEAVDICRKNNDIDLILMDIKMPIMDGHDATKEIRKFNKDIIIIAQTAHAFEGDQEKAIAAGCNEYLSKPLVINEVISLIQQYFIN